MSSNLLSKLSVLFIISFLIIHYQWGEVKNQKPDTRVIVCQVFNYE